LSGYHFLPQSVVSRPRSGNANDEIKCAAPQAETSTALVDDVDVDAVAALADAVADVDAPCAPPPP